jgi:amidase
MPHSEWGPFDPGFASAAEAAEVIRRKVVSSRELTEHLLARIRKHDPTLHLFITLAEERALAEARQADERLARREATGPLHGVPVTVKDVFATAGIRTTSGSQGLAGHIPQQDAAAVARLRAAGAIVVGKTSVPELAADWQTFNELAGTACNPWDLARTPGGSTGGGAAAVAAGLSFLELGGDLEGSLRIPSHFCGIYGHRPTIDLVPTRGHIPPPPGTPPGVQEFPAAGPLARSALDLRLALEVLAGPDVEPAVGYRSTLPPPRQATLGAYRIGYVLDDPFCPVDAPVKEVLAATIAALRGAGARLEQGWPAGVEPGRDRETYGWLLAAFFSQTISDEEHARMQRGPRRDAWTAGMTASHREWLARSSRRLQCRAAWQTYFRDHDVFLTPVCFVSAFLHDQGPDLRARTVKTAAGERPYLDLSAWTTYPTFTGCPATVAPAGRTPEGLPVGVQIMGPFLEDATPIDVAVRLAEVTGGQVAPPQFANP